jgi:hypothetical protein
MGAVARGRGRAEKWTIAQQTTSKPGVAIENRIDFRPGRPFLFWKIGPARNPDASRDSEVKITNQSRERLHEGGPYVIKSRERPLRKGLYVINDCQVMQTCLKMLGGLPHLT